MPFEPTAETRKELIEAVVSTCERRFYDPALHHVPLRDILRQEPRRSRQSFGGGPDVIERKLQLLEERGWFADIHRSREALDRLFPHGSCCE